MCNPPLSGGNPSSIRATQEDRTSPILQPLASPQASVSPRHEGGRVGGLVESSQPIKLGPVTNPNPQSLKGQSLLSTAHIPTAAILRTSKSKLPPAH